MLIGIREIKNAYPYINNKDIDMVLKAHNLEPHIQYVIAGNKPRPQNVWYIKDIERIFGPIQKEALR